MESMGPDKSDTDNIITTNSMIKIGSDFRNSLSNDIGGRTEYIFHQKKIGQS
jgi:hypothetical protein